LSDFEIAIGKVKNGKVVLKAGRHKEGTAIRAFLFEDVPVRVTEEQREWLLLSIASGVVDDGKDASEVLDEIIRDMEREDLDSSRKDR